VLIKIKGDNMTDLYMCTEKPDYVGEVAFDIVSTKAMAARRLEMGERVFQLPGMVEITSADIKLIQGE
jgi:hypothetical protein